MMISTQEELFAAIFNETVDRSPDEIREIMRDRKSRLFLLSRIHERWWRAHTAARRFGFVGVGQIAFAERRMVKFQQRLFKQS
jgi:hypothetical protein